MSTKRMLQLGEQIRDFIATLFVRGELRDPRVQNITIHSVKMTSDLQIAKVYFVAPASSEANLKEVLAGLKAAAPFIRRELGRQLQIRFIPQILFYFDDSIEYSLKMTQLLHKVKVESEQESVTLELENPIENKN